MFIKNDPEYNTDHNAGWTIGGFTQRWFWLLSPHGRSSGLLLSEMELGKYIGDTEIWIYYIYIYTIAMFHGAWSFIIWHPLNICTSLKKSSSILDDCFFKMVQFHHHISGYSMESLDPIIHQESYLVYGPHINLPAKIKAKDEQSHHQSRRHGIPKKQTQNPSMFLYM